MAEILPRNVYMGMIFFIFVILGGMYLINEMIKDKPDFLDSGETDEFEKFNESFNKIQNLTSSVESIKSNVETQPDEGLLGKFGMLEGLINSAWNTLVFLFTSLDFMNNIFNSLGTTFEIPGWVSALLILIFIVIIAFGILKMIFKAEI